MTRDNLLSEFIEHYQATSLDTLSPGYVVQLRVACNLLDRHHGRPVRLRDLSDQLVNGLCDHLQQLGRSPETIRGRRNSVLCLWREAWRQEIVPEPPLRIRRVRTRRKVPQAWTREEVARVVEVALRDRHRLRTGAQRGLWMASLVAAGWDTALRLGDLLAMPYGQVSTQPSVVVQQKTGDEVLVSLSAYTAGLIDRLHDQTRTVLCWQLWANRREFFVQFAKLRQRAGLECGSFKWVRRAAITDVERAGGDGSRLAGHRSRYVTERHYIDASQLAGVRRPQPLSR